MTSPSPGSNDPERALPEHVPSSPDIPPLVVIGAQSRAGRAIARRWPDGKVVAVHRGGADATGVVLADYADVPDGAIPPDSVVVNCVGTPDGSPAVLTRLNHDVALAWARAAVDARATQFIQLSSFSVYGRVERIAADTPEVPTTAYGQSKLAADHALFALDRGDMVLTALRIPMLFGDGKDKLTQLVRAALKLRIVPSTTPRMERSMLGYDALAAAVFDLARRPVGGVVHVADPTAFTYEMLRDRIDSVTGRRMRTVLVPRIAGRAALLLAPAIHARLLASSLLAPSLAHDFAMPPEADLATGIDRIVGNAT